MARIKTNCYTHTKSYCIIEDYKRNGKRTTRVVDNIGNYEKVAKLANAEGIDVDTWLNNYLNEYRKKNGLISDDGEKVIIEKYTNKLIPANQTIKFNVGYLFLEDIYYSLKINNICKNINLKYKFEFDLNEVLSYLVYSRIIFPSSKLKTYELSKKFIETPKYNLVNLYRGLTYLNKELDYMQKELYNNSKSIIDRDTRILYYDCTNYYFDIYEETNKKSLSEIEIECLKLIDYYLSYASPISFLEIFFINGIIFSTDNVKTEHSGRIYELILDLLEKIMLLSNEYIKYNPLCLCSCIVSFSREIYHLERWPQILSQTFGVNFSSFESIYNEFHDYIKNDDFYMNNNYNHKSLIKFNKENYNKYLNNKNNSIEGNNFYKKNINNTSIKDFRVEYGNEHKEDKKKIEIDNINKLDEIDLEMEIPSLTQKKNFGFKSIFDSKIMKINDNFKVKKQLKFGSNKEEDYSNAATSENSNNYNKNPFRLNNDKIISKNISSNNEEEEKNIMGLKCCAAFSSQKKYNIRKYERWNSIKKINKMKTEEEPKKSFYPYTEMKHKKNY